MITNLRMELFEPLLTNHLHLHPLAAVSLAGAAHGAQQQHHHHPRHTPAHYQDYREHPQHLCAFLKKTSNSNTKADIKDLRLYLVCIFTRLQIRERVLVVTVLCKLKTEPVLQLQCLRCQCVQIFPRTPGLWWWVIILF